MHQIRTFSRASNTGRLIMRPSGQVIAGRHPYLSQPNIDRGWSIQYKVSVMEMD